MILDQKRLPGLSFVLAVAVEVDLGGVVVLIVFEETGLVAFTLDFRVGVLAAGSLAVLSTGCCVMQASAGEVRTQATTRHERTNDTVFLFIYEVLV
ncbi:hypothetical protein F7231_08745 [Fibrella aestuarina]|uniref:Uncharacterized protein n=1 Tax=Fibrivirga algicola TaxID=2950420 RepID=A0ABX0QGD9_9BACT|nr:hypothetical protein [Fibrivirga algicola]